MVDFSERFIKGRIAETVFELMFHEQGEFDVYPLGYEYTIPALCQVEVNDLKEKNRKAVTKIKDHFSDTPDFLLIKQDKTDVFVVEVKYEATFDLTNVLEIAEKINAKWAPVWLFVATLEGFYFGDCKSILYRDHIDTLPTSWISPALQEKYLKLIKEYEK